MSQPMPGGPGAGSPAVGVIGLGAMGRPTAAAFASAGHRVLGFDPSEAARDAAADSGVDLAGSPAEVVPAGGTVFLSLPTPTHVLEVARRLGDQLDGVLVADLSTIDPVTAAGTRAVIERSGGRYVDAPVLGRPDRVGRWTLAVGGTEPDVARLASLAVGVIATRVERIGEVGSGSILKILNNLMFGAINTITAEVIDLAAANGIDADRFVSVVSESGAATVSGLFRAVAPKMAAQDYGPTFTLGLLAKDVRLGIELAEGCGRSAPVSEVVESILAKALALGLDDLDTAAAVEVYRRSDGRP